MNREYRRIEQYEEEILRMRADGNTGREICEKYGPENILSAVMHADGLNRALTEKLG